MKTRQNNEMPTAALTLSVWRVSEASQTQLQQKINCYNIHILSRTLNVSTSIKREYEKLRNGINKIIKKTKLQLRLAITIFTFCHLATL